MILTENSLPFLFANIKQKGIKRMTPEERILKSEQRIRAEKQKIAEAKKEANQIRRDAENHQKYIMGGLVAKYLKEEIKQDYMDFSEEELTRFFTEIFSVRTDILPEVVCASFGDHCMEQNAYLR